MYAIVIKSSDAAEQFLLYRGVVLGQMEIAIDQSFPALAGRKLFRAITPWSQVLIIRTPFWKTKS
jgi:hypothetical protein